MLGGKLYIEGKRQSIVVTDHDEVQAALETNLAAVVARDGNGNMVTVPRERVISLVEYRPGPDIEPGFLDGKQVTFRGLAAHNRSLPDGERYKLPEDSYEDQCVAVIGEDLAEAEILIYDLGNDKPIFTNPAEPMAAIERYVRVIRLLAEADAIGYTADAVAYDTHSDGGKATHPVPEPRTADEVGADSLPE